ncbi:MAG: class B sortase [Eubacterium sp.]|nr:class B sortase [Eubacterium sp.]
MIKRKKLLRIVLFCAALAVFLIAGYQLYSYFSETIADEKFKNSIADEAVEAVEVEEAYSDNKETPPISVDFDALKSENEDIVAWIYCENTPINYPIVQSSDNSYYLNRRIDKQYSKMGTLFLDYRNSFDFSDLNSIVYGHNMKVDTMFGVLPNYRDQEYYESHPVMWLFTPQNSYKIELFAGFLTTDTSDIYSIKDSREEFNQYLNEAVSSSVFTSNIEVSPDKNIILLSTCSYETDNSRFVLLGNLVSVN